MGGTRLTTENSWSLNQNNEREGEGVTFFDFSNFKDPTIFNIFIFNTANIVKSPGWDFSVSLKLKA